MRKRINMFSMLVATVIGMSCFALPVYAGDGDYGWGNDNNIEKIPIAEDKTTQVNKTIGTGESVPGYHKEMQDTSTIITDTTNVKEVEKEELSAKEEKEAWANWVESLYNESECVLTEGYEDGTITRVLKSHMNRIPELKIIDNFWVPCDPDDIGAVRF